MSTLLFRAFLSFGNVSAIFEFMSAAEFAGKRVFVTGGSKGVGEAIVRRFAVGGATVGTTARSPLPAGNTAKLFVQADLSTRDGVEKILREVLEEFGVWMC